VGFQKGHTKLGGRKVGSINVRTRKMKAELGVTGETPLGYMLRVLHNPKESAERKQWAAATAAPFVHPRLAAVDSRVVAEVKVSPMSEGELRAEARRLIAEAFRERPVVVDAEYKVIGGRNVAADVSAQANGEQQEEREG
jgi:hypothetical protein